MQKRNEEEKSQRLISSPKDPQRIRFVMNVFSLVSLVFLIIQPTSHSQESPKSTESSHLWSRCYDDLGCVNNTEEWFDVVSRPLREPPLPRHIIKTTFTLFTRGKVSVELEPLFPTTKHITGSSFDAAKPRTHILIHDFTSNGMAGWIKHAVRSLLNIEAGNVISVDWTGGAEPPYKIAVQNARIVALEVALLMEKLSEQFSTLSPQMFYLIGQGLGAHVAGYVGQKINGIGRITGLDPVGLYFKHMPPSTRLDPEDANFVDIVNTDVEEAHGQGSDETFGHFNFFPNGGLRQSGCNLNSSYLNLAEISRDALKEGQTAPGCNHKRAAKYYTASIDEMNNECTQMGYACGDYKAFERAECLPDCKKDTSCSLMGYLADVAANNITAPTTTKFFLDTSDSPPYCMFAYKIIVALVPSDDNQASKFAGMTNLSVIIRLSVYAGMENIVLRADLNIGLGQKPLNTDGDNVFLAYQKPPRIKNPDKMVLRIDSEDSDMTAAYVRYVKISELPDLGKSVPTFFCGRDDVTRIENHVDVDFSLCDGKFFISDRSATFDPPLRERRNPGEKPPPSDMIEDSEYDESEIPEPAEDDYYSN